MHNRNPIVDNLRGLAMLGVVGIHCGALVQQSATPWPGLYVLCEVLTRFAVPAFFAVSGYGLFRSYPLEQPLRYGAFLRGRLRALVLPYAVWSWFYLVWFQDPGWRAWWWNWPHMLYEFAYGKFCYQLYFMVILFWFYVSLPLWRKLVAWLDGGGRARLWGGLTALTAVQLVLFHINATWWRYPAWMKEYPRLITALHERMSWCPLLYMVVFVLGALAARHEATLRAWLQRNLLPCIALFLAAAAAMLARVSHLRDAGQDIWTAAPQVHQLTPEGLLYTVAFLLCASAMLERLEAHQSPLLSPLAYLSRHSMVVYMVHPVFLDGIPLWLAALAAPAALDGQTVATTPNALSVHIPLLYTATVLFSLAFAQSMSNWGRRFPLLNLLLTGKQ